MLDESTVHLHEVIDEASNLLSGYLKKPVNFSKVVRLSEPDRRNVILRLLLANPHDALPKSIILKQTVAERDPAASETEREMLSRFAHDWAGIQFLTDIGSDHAPHFYAGSLAHNFILIEDLGLLHPSLVGPLTRAPSVANVQEAESALIAYVRRIGKMHVDTFGKANQFTVILQRIYPQAKRYNFLTEVDLSDMVDQFTRLLGDASKELTKEIESVVAYSQNHGDFHVLLHGDICPDNVYYQGNVIRLIDFEFSDFGNALIDGVYLRMSMPSCWCSKAVPQAVLYQMETAYREELKKGISGAANDDVFNKHLTYACAYWVIRTISTLDVTRDKMGQSGPVDADSQWDPEKNRLRPRVLSRLDSFFACAKNTGHLPKLCEASRQLLAYLKKIWPESRSIDLFPVFRDTL